MELEIIHIFDTISQFTTSSCVSCLEFHVSKKPDHFSGDPVIRLLFSSRSQAPGLSENKKTLSLPHVLSLPAFGMAGKQSENQFLMPSQTGVWEGVVKTGVWEGVVKTGVWEGVVKFKSEIKPISNYSPKKVFRFI